MQSFDVLNIGAIIADIPIQFPATEMDFKDDMIFIPDLKMIPGGDAANSSVILSQLGKRVVLSSVVGDDLFGNAILNDIASRGVNIDYVRKKHDSSTIVSIALINKLGDRTFVSNFNGSTEFYTRDIDQNLLSYVKHINISSLFALPDFEEDGGPSLISKAKDMGLSTSADAISDINGRGFKGIKKIVEHLDIFMPSYVEAKAMTGETEPKRMIEYLIKNVGERVIIIKLGQEGCFVHEPQKNYMVPAFKVRAIDTTGAGDTFVAGVIAAYLDKMPIEDCVRYGSAAAALNVQFLGPASPFVTKPSISSLIKQI